MTTLDKRDRMTSSSERSAHPPKAIVLTHEWRRYAKTRDRRARDQLVLAYSPIVKYVAGRMVRGMPSHVEIADLISYGLGGLIQAVERFEPGHDTTFETYAHTRIRGAMIDGMREMDWVPRRVRVESRLVDAATLTLTSRLQRLPTDAELAAQLSTDAAGLEATLKRVADTRVVALDQPRDRSGGGGEGAAPPLTIAETLTDPRAVDPADRAQAQELRERIAEAIEKLPEKQRIVLGLRYEQEFSLQEIGDVLGFSESRACQLHTQATRTLRELLTAEPAPALAGPPPVRQLR